MAETAALIISNRSEWPKPELPALFHRVRKNFFGFLNEGNNGFKLVTLNSTSDPVKPSSLAKKTEKSLELSETGLDSELSFEITFPRIGAGLRNLGNTCFLNSVLQCLTYTAPLAAYLQSGKHQNSCCTAGFCALCAIQKHVSRAPQSTGRILEPKDLVSNLRCISQTFRNARQEDAHEYMVNLLESMHKCCLLSGIPSESPSAYEKSLVHKIFGGQLRSQVKCMQCYYCSNKFYPFLDLSLDIAKAESLYKTPGHFTAKEELDGGSREYKYEQCKQKVKALKQLAIHKAPEVLAVHLKRFSALPPGQKIDRKVSFVPTLDLKPFVIGPYVVQVNEKKVLEHKAYMLFYVRDRKNVGAKNRINVLQKENVVMTAIGNATYSKFNLELNERIQNGLHQKNLNGSSSKVLSRRDALVGNLPTENVSSNLNGKLTAEHLSPVLNTNSESLMVPPTKAPLEEPSVLKMNSVDCKGDSCSSVVVSVGTSSLGHAAVNISGNKLSVVEEKNTPAIMMMLDCGRPQNSLHKKVPSNYVVMPSSCKDSCKEKPSESAEKPLSSSVFSTSYRDSCKMNGTISDMNASNGGINHMQSSIEQSVGVGQVGTSSIKTAGPNPEDTVGNGQTMSVQSTLLSDLPATTEPHVALGTELVELGMRKKRQGLKVRGKIFKCHVTTSLSSNIIFGVGFCLRKQKQKKRQKRHHHCMKKKSPDTKDSIGVNSVPSKLGKSATEESFPLVVNPCTLYHRNKVNDVSGGQKQNLSLENVSGECSISGDIDNVFRERILLNESAVSAEEQPQVRQATAQETGEPEECPRELRQADVMSILTGGLEETAAVARWDDIGVSFSKTCETRAAQIGYIGDEWDEEYDRGKRKKVRGSKISFDGPNLFQEFANKNSKAKRAKLNRSREGNQPFRIL